MPKVEIVEAKAHYCGAILRRLRFEHAASFAMVGLNAHRELRATFMASYWRRAALMDGSVVGMWGVKGSFLSASGFVWLCMTNEAARHRIAALRLARQQIDEMMNTKRELYTTVLRDDVAALRLCSWLGFHVGHDGLGAPASDKRGRQLQMKFIQDNPEIRIPAGKSYAMVLGYHGERAMPCVS